LLYETFSISYNIDIDLKTNNNNISYNADIIISFTPSNGWTYDRYIIVNATKVVE